MILLKRLWWCKTHTSIGFFIDTKFIMIVLSTKERVLSLSLLYLEQDIVTILQGKDAKVMVLCQAKRLWG